MLLERNKLFDTLKDVNFVKSFLKQEEGIRNYLYQDHKGIQTIGVGFNCERADAADILKQYCDVDLFADQKIILNDDQIETLFEYCITEALKFIIRKITSQLFEPLTANQQCALVSLVFNNPSLLGPHLIHCIKTQSWQAAADEIRNHSNKSHDIHLQPRREREAALFSVQNETFVPYLQS